MNGFMVGDRMKRVYPGRWILLEGVCDGVLCVWGGPVVL